MGLKMAYKKIQTRYNVINNLKKRCVQDNKNFTISRLKSLILSAILTAQKIQKKPMLHSRTEMMGLIGMGNNPMVGATAPIAVAATEACK